MIALTVGILLISVGTGIGLTSAAEASKSGADLRPWSARLRGIAGGAALMAIGLVVVGVGLGAVA